jgi:predicted PurR-regulated permease PerM
MKAKPTFYQRVFALAIAAILGYALILIFLPFLSSMTWAAFLAFLLFPVNVRLRRRIRGHNSLAAGLLTVVAPIGVLLPLSLMSIEFAAQISGLLQKLQLSAVKLDINTFADLQKYPLIARANIWLQEHGSVSAEQIQGWLISGTREILQRAAHFGGSFFLGALSSVIGFGLMLFLLFFFLRDGDTMVHYARKLIPLDEELKDRLFKHLGDITRAIVFGTSMTAMLQGILLGLGFTIAELPSPVVFGVVGALLAMLPVGGTAFVWGPAVVYLFLNGHSGLGIFMLLWGIMLSTLDNILRPLLISGRARVSTLAVFIGVLGGISAFGAIGIIAGPIVLSLALALVEFVEERRAKTA